MKNNFEIGYCGNVHPATTLDQLLVNIETYTAAIANQIGDLGEVMPFGIWLSKSALDELKAAGGMARLRETMSQNHVSPFTINGFPFGDFHQPVVKHSVYEPTWASPQRLEYTIALADLHHQILPAGAISTISTLPLGWPTRDGQRIAYRGKRLRLEDKADESFLRVCAEQLLKCAQRLQKSYQETGRHTMICIEPEPGCVMDLAEDVCAFFQNYLYGHRSAAEIEVLRSHIGVCHDICHSAVMFEDQADAIAAYHDAGIAIGKVQVSSAIEVDFDSMESGQHDAAWESLDAFAEPKYLHQTCIRQNDEIMFFEDLGIAREMSPGPQGVWRVHFHVPIFATTLGPVGTTQDAIGQCVAALFQTQQIHGGAMPQHFEVETYAWNVLPDHFRAKNLADGIARELVWFQQLIAPLLTNNS